MDRPVVRSDPAPHAAPVSKRMRLYKGNGRRTFVSCRRYVKALASLPSGPLAYRLNSAGADPADEARSERVAQAARPPPQRPQLGEPIQALAEPAPRALPRDRALPSEPKGVERAPRQRIGRHRSRPPPGGGTVGITQPQQGQ